MKLEKRRTPHTMGLLQYGWDNKTRIIHLCEHLIIKDRVPEAYYVVNGSVSEALPDSEIQSSVTQMC